MESPHLCPHPECPGPREPLVLMGFRLSLSETQSFLFSNHQEMPAQPLGPAHRNASVLALPLGEVFTAGLA